MNTNEPVDYIPFKETGYFSKFICDYLEEANEIRPFYNLFPRVEHFKEQIIEKTNSGYNVEKRELLAEVLEEQYKGFKCSKATKLNIEFLKKENTFTITTGHQLNLFTGPLYFLYKIVSTINLTKILNSKYPDFNFVPIYWMASEDHDFDEINYFNFGGKKLQWNTEQTGAVGRFELDGLSDVFKVVVDQFGSGKNAEQLKNWFETAYLSHDNLSDATRYLANVLFGEFGLVIIDADNRRLKKEFIPFIKDELFEENSFKQVSNTNTKLKELGLKIQVNPREINLFYINDGIRERIQKEAGNFSVVNSEKSWNKTELINELEQFPERFSPNVIMRPLYQEVILPNLCYIGGGGEMIYWLQLKSNFERQNIPFPILLLRNSVLIKSKKQANKLDKLDISIKDLFLKRNTFINKRVRKVSNIEIDFTKQIQYLNKQFLELHQIAEDTDKSFLGAVKAQEIKQIKGLKHLEKRLLKAQKRKLADQISRCTELQEQLFPNQGLQERSLNFSEIYLEYGEVLIPNLIEHLNPLKSEFIVLTM